MKERKDHCTTTVSVPSSVIIFQRTSGNDKIPLGRVHTVFPAVPTAKRELESLLVASLYEPKFKEENPALEQIKTSSFISCGNSV